VSKHTPGPWHVDQTLGFPRDVYAERGFMIATAYEVQDADNGPESCANARLMAAAPDLLEALKEMEALIPVRSPKEIRVPHSTHAKMKAAIAKACGERREAKEKVGDKERDA
jgi:hypothetical protein